MVWEKTVSTESELQKLADWLTVRRRNNIPAEIRLVSRRPVSMRIKVGDDRKPSVYDAAGLSAQGRLPKNQAAYG